MRVVAHDLFMTADQADEHGTKLVGLAELLNRADVITIHVPLTAQTRGLIGEAQIGAMKPGAVLSTWPVAAWLMRPHWLRPFTRGG
jgi:phosphoglycerate dehydrogenase-like enzyme